MTKTKINEILDILEVTYPDAECALHFHNVYQLLVAVMLSAQTTDKSVNKVTPLLFQKLKNPREMADAEKAEIESIIKTIGMYHTKAKNLINMAKMLIDDFDGEVPNTYDELIKLPGVGRKTANVVLSVGFGEQRIAVDTHVFRVSNRIGMVREKDVLKTEKALMKAVPKERWSRTHHSLIFHGRNVCTARSPKCDICTINQLCSKNLE